MNNQELAQVLAKANVIDARLVVDEAVFAAWGELIGDLDHKDALDAVAEHYRSSTARIMPKDIRDLAKRYARRRHNRERQSAGQQEAIEQLASEIALTEREHGRREAQREGVAAASGWAHTRRTWQDHLDYLENEKLTYPTWYAAAEERAQRRLEVA